MNPQKILLVYDTQCPACDFYCNLVRIRESVGELELVDARDNPPVMAEINQRGWDIDDGMVLKVGEQLYYGSDAIHALSLMGSKSGFFNRLSCWVFRSEGRAHFFYPILRGCRAVMLRMMGISRINNLNIEGRDRF